MKIIIILSLYCIELFVLSLFVTVLFRQLLKSKSRMNLNSQLQNVFDKIKLFDGIGLLSALKECRDVNGIIDDTTALMLVTDSNWN